MQATCIATEKTEEENKKKSGFTCFWIVILMQSFSLLLNDVDMIKVTLAQSNAINTAALQQILPL